MNETSQPASCSRCGTALAPGALKGLCPRCLMELNLVAPTEIPGEAGPHGTTVTKPLPTPEEIANHFPQLEILECLGRGGMGVVYKARQPRLDRLVALKILAPEKEQEPKFAERFAREAKALARLNHPNIVTVHDFGEADGMFYLLMEYVDGVSLRQLLHARKIAPEEALSIVPKICDALQFAHELGVVHRDIKPENVLLDKQGRVKIADFGIAKIVAAEGRVGSPLPAEVTPPEAGAQGTARPTIPFTQDQVVGTPQYMAPEQVEKPQLVDHRADIYSLGVVFYEMLTGELPLGKFAPPSRMVKVDVRLDEVVLQALEKEPERRYQTAAEFKTVVETISSSSSPGTGTAPLPARPAATRGRLRAALIVGVLVWWFVAGTVTLITWIRAESWKVVAVISCPRKSQPGRPVDMDYFKHAATMIELIRSDVILGRVIDRLELDERSGKLDERWGKRNLGLRLTKAQAMVLLRRRLDVRSSEGGTLIQVGVYGKRPEKWEEAIDIADAIAQEFRAFRIEQHDSPADMLEMTLRATAPDILLGLAAGFVLGLLAGGLVLWRGFPRRGPQASRVKTAVGTTAATAAPRPPSARESADLENARGQVKVPAIGLIVISGLNLLILAVGLPIWIYGAALSIAGRTSGVPWTFVIPLLLLMAGCNLVALIGAWRMKQLRSYQLAVVGSILFMLSPWLGLSSGIACRVSYPVWSIVPGVLLGLLFGIWSLIALNRREVREAFGKPQLPPLGSAPSTPTSSSASVAAPSAARGPRAALARIAIAMTVLVLVAGVPAAFSVPIVVLCLLSVVVLTIGTVARAAEPVPGARMTADAWITVAIALALGGGLLTAALILKNKDRAASQTATVGPEAANEPASGVRVSFGPVIERELSGSESLSNCFLDLDSGRILSAPKELVESLHTRGKLNGGNPNADLLREWMRSSGADIVKRTGGESNRWSLVQLDGVCEMLPEEAGKKFHAEDFDTVSVEPVIRALKSAGDAQPGGLTAGNPGRRLSFRGDGLFAFKTREGGMGVLQVLGEKHNLPSVKLRYKLVQQAAESDSKGR